MCGKFGERTIIKFFLEKWSLSKVRAAQTGGPVSNTRNI